MAFGFDPDCNTHHLSAQRLSNDLYHTFILVFPYPTLLPFPYNLNSEENGDGPAKFLIWKAVHQLLKNCCIVVFFQSLFLHVHVLQKNKSPIS